MKNKGFTFIEVLIVLAIIGLLLALFVPSCVQTSRRAEVKELGFKFDSFCYNYVDVAPHKGKAKITKITKWVSRDDFRVRIEYDDGLFFDTVDPNDLTETVAKVADNPLKRDIEVVVYAPLPLSETQDMRHKESSIKANKTFDSDFDDFFHTQLKSEE